MARIGQKKRKAVAVAVADYDDDAERGKNEVKRGTGRASGSLSSLAVAAANAAELAPAPAPAPEEVVQIEGRRTRRRPLPPSRLGEAQEEEVGLDGGSRDAKSPLDSSNDSSSNTNGDDKKKSRNSIKGESVQMIKERLQEIQESGDEAVMERYLLELSKDPRDSVLALVDKWQAKAAAKVTETLRLEELMVYEREIYERVKTLAEVAPPAPKGTVNKGKKPSSRKVSTSSSSSPRPFYIVGVDEVGVGPLAGPIVSCAVAFQYERLLEKLPSLVHIDDSKKLNAAKRERLSEHIKKNCCASVGYGIVTAQEVDTLNPLQGSLVAMLRAVQSLNLPVDCSIYLLVDHHTIPGLQGEDDRIIEQTSITKGDSKSIAIAAASIVAKVYRDEYMTTLHERYPNFKFDQNAGYGTSDHLKELRKGLLCPEHRLSFAPVKAAHRKSQGLAPEVEAPKRKTRGLVSTAGKSCNGNTTTRRASSSKSNRPTEKEEIDGELSTLSPAVAAAATATPRSVLSMTWWTSWFSKASSSSTPPQIPQVEQAAET